MFFTKNEEFIIQKKVFPSYLLAPFIFAFFSAFRGSSTFRFSFNSKQELHQRRIIFSDRLGSRRLVRGNTELECESQASAPMTQAVIQDG
jgi:hypothetical protein